jgi:hypothetical protein
MASMTMFGDGSVVCLPTHGHTPGHQSLRVRLDSNDVVLAADACYFCQTCASGGCRATSSTARRLWHRSTRWRRWKRAGRASSSATTPNSGRACRKPPTPSHEAALKQIGAQSLAEIFHVLRQ